MCFKLKAEELGDSEYRQTVGQPYDYSAGRMQELRREASRYREAHVGRARDSWVTLSQAIRIRRRRDLELLSLPPAELATRLPPGRPSKYVISSEVAAMNSSFSFNCEFSIIYILFISVTLCLLCIIYSCYLQYY